MTTRIRTAALGAFAALPLVFSACASAGRLGDYDFRDHSVAVVATLPPRPYVDSGDDVDLSGLSPLQVAVKVGSGIYKEVQAGRLRARMDSAGSRLDVSERISTTLLGSAARTLGGRPVSEASEADFHLEVRVEEYGVSAPEWDDEVRFRLKGRLLLLDRDGREVWKAQLNENERVSDSWFLAGSPATDVWTGHALGSLTVDEIVRVFESIADHTAYKLNDKLRQGLEKARKARS